MNEKDSLRMTASHNASGAAALAWLDSLHVTDADGAVTNRKWPEAQQVKALVESAMALPGKWREEGDEASRALHAINASKALALHSCADELEAIFGSAPPATDAPELDDEARDEPMWALIGIAEGCGAMKDAGDDGTFWTFTLDTFFALEAKMRDALNAMRYADATPPAGGGDAGCGACGDSCAASNGCRLAAESPSPETVADWLTSVADEQDADPEGTCASTSLLRDAATAIRRLASGGGASLDWALAQGGVLADWCNVSGAALSALMAAYERRVRSDCTPEQLAAEPWRCAEFVQAEQALKTKPSPSVEITTPPPAPAAEQGEARGASDDIQELLTQLRDAVEQEDATAGFEETAIALRSAIEYIESTAAPGAAVGVDEDAVLAEMRRGGGTETGWIGIDTARQWADRLQSAHEAEVAERDRMVGEQLAIAERAKAEALRQQQERLAATVRADRAVGLLRECQPYVSSMAQASHLTDGFSPKPANAHDELAARLTAFLSEQAGERENGDE